MKEDDDDDNENNNINNKCNIMNRSTQIEEEDGQFYNQFKNTGLNIKFLSQSAVSHVVHSSDSIQAKKHTLQNFDNAIVFTDHTTLDINFC